MDLEGKHFGIMDTLSELVAKKMKVHIGTAILAGEFIVIVIFIKYHFVILYLRTSIIICHGVVTKMPHHSENCIPDGDCKEADAIISNIRKRVSEEVRPVPSLFYDEIATASSASVLSKMPCYRSM